RSAAGRIARRLLPASACIPAFLGWLWLVGQRLQVYHPVHSLALLVVLSSALLAAMIWWNAGMLYRAELAHGEAARALEDSEALYHSLVESLPLNIFRKDLEGHFTFANRRFF